MPSISSVALLSLAAVGAIAAPAQKRGNGHYGKCISDSQADQVATTWAALIQNYSNELADATLTEDFTDYSESVNTLINSCPQGDAAKPIPLLAPTFSTREQFKLGQGQQPPINFERLNLWHDCTSVNFRWKTTNTANITDVKPVVGIITLELAKNNNTAAQYPWLIETAYSEFDSGAWLQNLVEAGICSTNAGLPSTGSNGTECAAPSSSGVVVAPTGVTAAPTQAPATTSPAAPVSTDDCDEDESAAPTAYATASAYA